MKKILILIAIIFIILMISNNKKDYYIIPNEAIRFRIVANSNSVYDQYIKNKVKNNLQNSFKKDFNKKTIDDTRTTIKNNITKYEKIVKNTLEKENYDKDFTINYGLNYFPEKIYKDIKYEEGNYESLVINIGDGKGDNFFCILFPPICMLEVDESDKIEYSFFIKELIERYLK